MGLMTYLFFDSENSMFLFSGGSVGSTMKYFGTSKWIVLFLYICIVFSILFYRKRLKQMFFCFMIFFSLWFLSGRVIGVHYSGEIISGWFYLQTNKVSLWKLDKCSEDLILNTSAEDKFPFRLKFSNVCTVNEIFIGPFIRSDVKNYFGQKKTERP